MASGVTNGRTLTYSACRQDPGRQLADLSDALGVGPPIGDDPIKDIVLVNPDDTLERPDGTPIVITGAPGPPGPPGAGTTIHICRAVVSQAGGVAHGTASFSFASAVAEIGTAPGGGTGTATNPDCPFAYGEVIKVVSTDGTNWFAIKLETNACLATVVADTTDPTDAVFSFENIAALRGQQPASGTGIGYKPEEERLVKGEQVTLIQTEDNKWYPMRREWAAMRMVAITASVPGAAWNELTNKLTPAEFNAKIWRPHVDDADDGSMKTTVIPVKSYYTTPITVTAGWFRVGYVFNGELAVVDCTEQIMPDGSLMVDS